MDSDNSKQAITKAVSELNSLVRNIGELGNVVLEIADEGVSVAKEQMAKYGIPTGGTLGDSIKATKVDAITAKLEADGGHATFVEFGTGIVGQQNPHKESAERSVDYDRNGHGEAGWTYPKDGKFYHTKGQPSKPFWYAAGKKIKSLGKKRILAKLKQARSEQ